MHSAVLAALALAAWGTAQAPTTLTSDQALHVLNRTTWGARAADVAALTGPTTNYYGWLDQQLNPDLGNDHPDVESVVAALAPVVQGDAVGLRNITGIRVMRAMASDWQLNEVMTQFWEQHFNTHYQTIENFLSDPSLGFSDPARIATWLEWDDHEYYRANALGSFRDLLRRTTLSPGMMIYLNLLNSSCVGGPNENYAREFVELYAMGPINRSAPAGNERNYDQDDIVAIAECFTGWRVDFNLVPMSARFVASQHCTGPKRIFDDTTHGVIINPGGNPVPPIQELDDVIDHVAAAEPTKDFICRKLMRVFLSDDAASVSTDAGLLGSMKAAWGAQGDIEQVLRVLLRSEQFLDGRHAWQRARMPVESVVWWARVWEGTIQDTAGMTQPVRLLLLNSDIAEIGQSLFDFPSPDGFPHESEEQPGSSVAVESYKAFSRLYVPDPQYPEFDVAALVMNGLPPGDLSVPGKVGEFLLKRLYGSAWTAQDLVNVTYSITNAIDGTPRGPLDPALVDDYAERLDDAAVTAGVHYRALLK